MSIDPEDYIPREDEQSKKNPWLALVKDGADTMGKELPPIVELVEGLIAELCKVVIGSGSKSFKTWLTIYILLCISHGKKVWGRPTIRRKVLYVNLELKEETFERRVQIIAKHLGIDVERGWFRHVSLRGKISGLALPVVINRIIETATAHEATVVVCDPVYKLNQGDENSSRDQTLFFNELDRLTTEAKCTLVLNDHFSKGNQSEKDPLDAIRGSSAKGGDVDAAIILRKHQVEECFRVDVIHRELPPVAPFCIGWEFPVMVLRPDLDPEEMKKPKGGKPKAHDPAKILSVIADTTEANPVAISDWAEKAGIKRQTLNGYLPIFRTKGHIQTTGEGTKARRYITKKGLEWLEQEAA